MEAYNGNVALGGWSAGLNFSVLSPTAPVITGPAAVVTTTTPTFSWNASADATNTMSGPTTQRRANARSCGRSSAQTSLTPAAAIPRGQYTVWVARENSAGSFGAWTSGYSFLIDSTAPAVSAINAPATPSPNLTPTISWSASNGATRYDLWVNNVSTGQSQVIRQQNLTGTSFTPGTALFGRLLHSLGASIRRHRPNARLERRLYLRHHASRGANVLKPERTHDHDTSNILMEHGRRCRDL